MSWTVGGVDTVGCTSGSRGRRVLHRAPPGTDSTGPRGWPVPTRAACPHRSPPEGATDLRGRGGGAGARESDGTGESPPLSSQPHPSPGGGEEKPCWGPEQRGRRGLRADSSGLQVPPSWGAREPQAVGCRGRQEGAGGPSGPQVAGRHACCRSFAPRLACFRGHPRAAGRDFAQERLLRVTALPSARVINSFCSSFCAGVNAALGLPAVVEGELTPAPGRVSRAHHTARPPSAAVRVLPSG